MDSYRGKSIYARLFDKIERAENGCILWQGRTVRGGYGQMKVGGKQKMVHKLSYELYWGKIPPGKLILHTCDTPNCINPFCLVVGTALDNARDRDQKGRGKFPGYPKGVYRGDNNKNSKLSSADVERIVASDESGPVLAERFGVTNVRISQIRRAAGIHRGRRESIWQAR